jgi:6-phosphogluconolactonase
MSNISLYFGTTAQNTGGGIYLLRFDTDSGLAQNAELVAQQPGASFLTATSNGRYLYAVNDGFLCDGEKTGGLSAYEIDAKTGHLMLRNTIATDGVLCHISLDHTEKWLLGAAYSKGTFSIWPIQEDGAIGPVQATVPHHGQSVDPRRQAAPHPHHIVASPNNQHIYVTDLGIDKVMIYDFDASSGKLSAEASTFAQLAPGAGPRHIAFHPSGDSFFVVNELDNTVTAFKNVDGNFTAIQAISTLPTGYNEPTWTAEILLSASGRFLYATNRGHHSIAIYRVNNDRSLTSLGFVLTGQFPQHIAFSPCGKWLLSANRDDSSISVYRVDSLTGKLEENNVLNDLPGKPMCLVFSDGA